MKRDAQVRRQAAKLRGLAAINRVRRGESKSLSAAARAEGTTAKTIRKLLPAALAPSRPGGRIQVKAWDPYWARVEIITDSGPVEVMARGSRQRELAGRHRAVAMRVLHGEEPASALEQFHGKKVGGQALAADFDRLRTTAEGVLDQLHSLYVAPETHA